MSPILSKYLISPRFASFSTCMRHLLTENGRNATIGQRFSSVALNLNRDDNQLLLDDPKFWVKSPHVDVKPIVGATTNDLIFSQLNKGQNRGQKYAIECAVSGRKYTFNDVYKFSRSFGAALINAGFKKGEKIAIVLPNIPEYALTIFGSWEAGLTISPVNPAYTPSEIKRQLQNSEVSCVVTIPNFLQTVREAQAELPGLRKIIVVGESVEADCHNFFSMLKTDTEGVQFVTANDYNLFEDVALLPYSSGTTGNPKGVMLTHTNLISCINAINQPSVCTLLPYDDNNEQERIIGILPFFHAYGFAAILCFGIFHGASTLSLPKFEPKMFLNALRTHKPTALHLVPPLIQFLVNSPEVTAEDLKNVHTIVGAAAPIGSVLINRLLEKAGKYIFFQEGYGMTELSPASHVNIPSVQNNKIGSCGVPIPNTWTKIIDPDTGRTLGRNERGELLVKGPQVMKGYYKNDEATRNTIDSQGWLHTGDIAYYDEDGFCYIVDRLKELIKVKGFQVAPSELEDELRKHPEVADVAVIGVSNEEWGELPRAYIVRRSKTLSEHDINLYLADKVASYKQLRGGIEFVEAIPKAPAGKILRRQLIQDYRAKNELS